MDGVLGSVNTEGISERRCNSPRLVENKKAVCAVDLKPKQTIRFEFGFPGNWVRMKIERIHQFDKQIILFGKNDGYQDDYSFEPDEMVELLNGRF